MPGTIQEEPEVVQPDMKKALDKIVRKITLWCPAMRLDIPALNYCNFIQDVSAPKLHSSLDALKASWLAVPTSAFPTTAVVDWSPDYQGNTFKYPSFTPASLKECVPKPFEAAYGKIPPPLPVTFSDPRVGRFFGSPSWYMNNRVLLRNPFVQHSIPGNELIKSQATSESLSKETLKGGSVLFDLCGNYAIRLGAWKQWALGLQSSRVSPSHDELLSLIDEFVSFTDVFRPCLWRLNLLASAAVMTAKKQARVLVLAKFNGLPDMKKALLHSDFGVPELFGPLESKMQANVDMHLKFNVHTWRLSLKGFDVKRGGGTSSSSSGPAKAPKRTNAARAAPAAVASPPFLGAGRGRGRGKGKGRGSKGK